MHAMRTGCEVAASPGRPAAIPEDDPLPDSWDEYGDERNWDWQFGDDPTVQ